MWKDIDGYKYQYKINDMGKVVRFDPKADEWVTVNPRYSFGRVHVSLRTKEGKGKTVYLVNLMADAFMGGRKPGECITYKNGSRLDCSVYNLKKISLSDASRLSAGSRRRSVCKVDLDGDVIAIYGSLMEAAKENHVAYSTLQKHLCGKIKNRYSLGNFDFVYEENVGKGRPKKCQKAVF